MPGPRLPDERLQDSVTHGAGYEGFGASTSAPSPTNRTLSPVDWICVASQRRVLIVDDNDRHLEILSAILGGVGHEVETCGSGAEALRRVSAHPYDLVVLDLMMPDIGGLAVATEMRAYGVNARTPIVICTANVPLARRDLEGVEGIHAIIGKPIDTAALVLSVEHAPGRERHSSQLRI